MPTEFFLEDLNHATVELGTCVDCGGPTLGVIESSEGAWAKFHLTRLSAGEIAAALLEFSGARRKSR